MYMHGIGEDPGIQPGSAILAMGSGAAMPGALTGAGSTAFGLAIPAVSVPSLVNNSTTQMPIFNAPPPAPLPPKPAIPSWLLPAALFGVALYAYKKSKRGRRR